MEGSIIWILAAFVIYLLFMIVIGMVYARKNENAEDYFLGGRKLNGAVAALSAQASDIDGSARLGLRAGYGPGMDCHRPVYRYGLQLALYFQTAAQIYHSCQQRINTAYLF